MPLSRTLILVALAIGVSRPLAAQEFDSPPVQTSSEPAFREFLSSVARRLAREYTNPDREVYLDNLMRMRIVSGDYPAALATGQELRAYRSRKPGAVPVLGVAYEIYAATKIQQATRNVSPLDALNHAFAERVATVDDVGSAVAMPFALGTWPGRIQTDLDAAIARARGL